jgi:mannose-6-phosphate isomerase class I
MWGGQHLVKNIEAMHAYPRCSHYYAMFPPVNSLLLHDGDLELEMPFENVMHLETDAMQGSLLTKAFGARMPIRATIMDTLEGMTLSHQIHPSHAQAKRIFNTNFDEPETYYFLETTPESSFYLGLRDDADPAVFRRYIQRALDEQVGFDLSDFVNLFPAHKNDVVHVPASMVHNAGPQNLILEVTTHPIGHTYRLYDFMRRTSDGKLRPLHVEQAFGCLDTARNRTWAEQQGLFPQPNVLEQGDGWSVSRRVAPPITKFTEDEISFTKEYTDDTRGERFHLLLGLEGDDLRVDGKGFDHPLHQYELLIVPAATGAYRLVNDGAGKARVLKLYVSSPEEYQAAEI